MHDFQSRGSWEVLLELIRYMGKERGWEQARRSRLGIIGRKGGEEKRGVFGYSFGSHLTI